MAIHSALLQSAIHSPSQRTFCSIDCSVQSQVIASFSRVNTPSSFSHEAISSAEQQNNAIFSKIFIVSRLLDYHLGFCVRLGFSCRAEVGIGLTYL